MLNIIHSNDNNKKQIVDLLKLSLGESTTKKSIEFWNWKHLQNPFGESIIILAFDNDNLVGVRALMKWKFQNQHQTITCGRAVDTAVHPNVQGKGIFTKLTLQALEEAKNNGVDLIFNTPNNISKIGYLKMGWIENGQMPILLSYKFSFHKRFSENFCDEIYNQFQLSKDFTIDNLLQQNRSNTFITALSKEYIIWRYKNCPVNKYGFLYGENNFLIVFRLKPVKSFIELRICETIVNDDDYSVEETIQLISKLIKKVKPLFISSNNSNKNIFDKIGITITKKIGPQTTLKTVSEINQIENFKNFTFWQPSLGCMELF